jgi:hypothetical protein
VLVLVNSVKRGFNHVHFYGTKQNKSRRYSK